MKDQKIIVRYYTEDETGNEDWELTLLLTDKNEAEYLWKVFSRSMGKVYYGIED